ncbi:universal stress protein [Luteibacter sp. CQ10]|uniref:universal stress protein n=1 Tax=Luteibacter sp. CQ10 TaxID=2805821 RepID=UPI0034A3D0A9
MSTLTVATMDGAALPSQVGMPAVGDVLVIADPGCVAATRVGSWLAARGRGVVTGCAMPEAFHHGRIHGHEPTVMALLQNAPERQRGDDLGKDHAGDRFVHEALIAGAHDPQWAVLGDDYLRELKALCSWHDLIVVQRTPPAREKSLGGLDELALACGLPMLILPTPCAPGATYDRIVIAYDGSGPATRALRSAMPLIVAARHVHLLDGSAGRTHLPRFDPVRFLARFGVTPHRRRVAERSIDGPQLLARVAKLEPDLLVMGAYGHSPLRERVLGGTTHHILGSATLSMSILVQH